MGKGGRRVGAGRPKNHYPLKFSLNGKLTLSELCWLFKIDEKNEITFDPQVNECWYCTYFDDDFEDHHKKHPWDNKDCKKCALGSEGIHQFVFNKESSLTNFFLAFLRERYFCVICKNNHPTKNILYRCKYQESCDIYPSFVVQTPEEIKEIPIQLEKIFLEEKLNERIQNEC